MIWFLSIGMWNVILRKIFSFVLEMNGSLFDIVCFLSNVRQFDQNVLFCFGNEWKFVWFQSKKKRSPRLCYFYVTTIGYDRNIKKAIWFMTNIIHDIIRNINALFQLWLIININLHKFSCFKLQQSLFILEFVSVLLFFSSS